jgi:hypothetical protein
MLGQPYGYGKSQTLTGERGKENDPSWALASPVGVLKANFGYTGAYSRSTTHNLEFDFDLETMTAQSSPKSTHLDDHPITKAAHAALQQLAMVDHTIGPCFKDPGIKLEVSFDIQDKTTIGGDFTLVIFKFGDKVVLSDEFSQTLELDFKAFGNYLESDALAR